MAPGEPSGEDPEDQPYPESLCHGCAAPPRYIRTARSIFIYCPIFKRYPPQPVRECDRYVPKTPGAAEGP